MSAREKETTLDPLELWLACRGKSDEKSPAFLESKALEIQEFEPLQQKQRRTTAIDGDDTSESSRDSQRKAQELDGEERVDASVPCACLVFGKKIGDFSTS